MLRYVDGPSVRTSVCLIRFLTLSRSLDGDMCASPFHTRSIGGSTVGYMATSKCYQREGISLRSAILVTNREYAQAMQPVLKLL